jgi:hypothetical protein
VGIIVPEFNTARREGGKKIRCGKGKGEREKEKGSTDIEAQRAVAVLAVSRWWLR